MGPQISVYANGRNFEQFASPRVETTNERRERGGGGSVEANFPEARGTSEPVMKIKLRPVSKRRARICWECFSPRGPDKYWISHVGLAT